MTNYLSADIANTPKQQLTFANDPKSQRAQAASSFQYNPNDNNNNKLEHETLFQIIFLENVSHSISQQFDELQSLNDVEGVGADRLRYGRQRVVRQVNVDGDDNNQQQQQQQQEVSNGINNLTSTFKLTLQDCFGNCSYAVELEKLTFLSTKNFGSGFPIQLGSKVLIKQGTGMFKGVLLLTKANTEFLGGIVPVWNQELQMKHMGYLRGKMDAI